MQTTDLLRRLVYRAPAMQGHTISIIGCGGIGARILPSLAKMLNRPTTIYLWDHDTVEVKNLLRQNFALPDVGKPKAQVLASRYASPMARIEAKVERWTDYQHGTPEGLVISAVDDWETRRSLLSQHYTPIIDCGNDGLRGQVLLGGGLDGYAVKTIDAFPELVTEPTDEMRRQLSCELGDTQTVVANQLAATLALTYIDALMNGRSLSHIGTMFSLPHGMWEIPAAAVLESWKGHDMDPRLIVYPGWTKSQAGRWQVQPDGEPQQLTRLDEATGWTQPMLDIVENALHGAGVERHCTCNHCVDGLCRALTRLNLTAMPPALEDRWCKVDVATRVATVGGQSRDVHLNRTCTCTQCEEEYRYGDSLDLGTEEPERFCCESCETNYRDENADPDEDENELPEEEPEPEEERG